MPLSRQKKEDLIESYRSGVVVAPHVFVVGFKGVTVQEDTELRAKVRESGGSYQVVKNRLVLRELEGAPLAELADTFQGPTAVAFSDDDPVSLAKVLTEFAKEVPAIEFKGGLVEGQPIDSGAIKDIAELPSRDELIAKLLFLMQSPVSSFVRLLGALPEGFVRVLAQVSDKKEE